MDSYDEILKRFGLKTDNKEFNRTISLKTIPKEIQEKYDLKEGKILNGAKIIA